MLIKKKNLNKKKVLCSEFPDIPDNAGRVTRRRRTQAIAKRYAFHAKSINNYHYDI